MAAIMRSAAVASGHRTRLSSTSSRVTAPGSMPAASTSRTAETQANTSAPQTSRRSPLATAPAATRPMVSRAEDRPPPATLRTPYLASYVASAWLGR